MRGDVNDDRSEPGSEAPVAQAAGVEVVAEFFGVKTGDADYNDHRALGIALIHDSFFYENRALYPDLTRGILRGIEAFGNAWFGRELAIRLYMSKDYDSVEGLATLHASATTAFLKWLESIDWLVDAVRYGKGEAQSRPSQATRRKLANQVIGAIALVGGDRASRLACSPFSLRQSQLMLPRTTLTR